jgi:transcription elongation GreA/GreB family factor
MARTNKKVLLEELASLVREDLATAMRAEKAAHEGATHEQAKPENDKDTRALEQSYLARGQSQRVEELRTGLGRLEALISRGALDVVALGALVEADEDGERRTFLMAPARGGTTFGDGVQVVTPSSPLGRALLGRRAGDDVEVVAAARTRTLSITGVE